MKKDEIKSAIGHILVERIAQLDSVLQEFLTDKIFESLESIQTVEQLSEILVDWIDSEKDAAALIQAVFQDLLDFEIIQIVKEEENTRDEDELEGCCKICERETVLTRHHLRPKTTHAKLLKKGLFTKEELAKTVDICRPCHSAVHRAEDEETLMEKYFTLDLIMTHPKVLAFIPYIRKQPCRTKADSLINLRFHK